MTDKAKQRWKETERERDEALDRADTLSDSLDCLYEKSKEEAEALRDRAEKAEQERDRLQVRHKEAVGLLASAGRGQDRAEQQAASMREELGRLRDAKETFRQIDLLIDQGIRGFTTGQRHWLEEIRTKIYEFTRRCLSQPPIAVEEDEADETPQWLKRADYMPAPQQHVEQPEASEPELANALAEVRYWLKGGDAEAALAAVERVLPEPGVDVPGARPEISERLKKIAYGLETGYFRDESSAVVEFASDAADLLRNLASREHRGEETGDLEAQVERLHAALKRFGKHSPLCAKRTREADCTCGLHEATALLTPGVPAGLRHVEEQFPDPSPGEVGDA